MRIAHFATSLSGGAGIAARRIVAAQRKIGIESNLFVVKTKDHKLEVFESKIDVDIPFQLKSKSLTYLQRITIQRGENLVTSLSLSNVDKLLKISQHYDLVHLHNTYNMIRISELKKITFLKPLVVTLHDQRILTGGCHYSLGCEKYVDNCKSCPQVRRPLNFLPQISVTQTKSGVEGIRHISLIAPSKWMADCARKSTLFRESPIHVVRNPVNLNFKENHNLSTTKRDLADEVFNIGFIANEIDNPIKGLQILLQALECVSEHRKIELKLFGKGKPNISKYKFPISIGSFFSDSERANAILSCDLIVVPSLEDNFPSVIPESLVLGIPVVGSDVGGITEVLLKYNLPRFTVGNSIELASILLSTNKGKLPQNLIKEARKEFGPYTSAENHLQIYENQISERAKD